MKKVLAVMCLFGTLNAFATEVVKCKADIGAEEVEFSVDVSTNRPDVQNFKIDGLDGYELSVNLVKLRALSKNYELNATLEKAGERTIFGRSISTTLPLYIRVGTGNLVTEEYNFLSVTCGI